MVVPYLQNCFLVGFTTGTSFLFCLEAEVTLPAEAFWPKQIEDGVGQAWLPAEDLDTVTTDGPDRLERRDGEELPVTRQSCETSHSEYQRRTSKMTAFGFGKGG